MTSAQQAIEAAIQDAARLEKNLRRHNGKQVNGNEEKQIIKATVLAWFNNHRAAIAPIIGEDHVKPADDEYRDLLTGCGRATLRSKYVTSLKRLRRLLAGIQGDHLVALSTDNPTTARTADAPPSFARLVADTKMQAILASRWWECVKCVEAGAPLAATVMMGGILEGLLLAKINQLADKSAIFKAAAAPKDFKTKAPLKLSEWTLKNYIDVAYELNWISRTTKDVGAVVRDYRNYIHPQKELSHGISLSTEDARTLWEIAKSISRQLL